MNKPLFLKKEGWWVPLHRQDQSSDKLSAKQRWENSSFTGLWNVEAESGVEEDKPSVQFSSVWLLSRVRLFVTPWPQHARPPCPSPTPEVYSNSCPLSRWCHPIISSCVIPFSSCLQSFPASGSFQMSQFFTSGGQRMELKLQHQPFQWIFRTDLF